MDIADMLQTYGATGGVVICLTIIWRMAAYIASLHEQQREDDKEAAEAQRADTKATVAALVETRDALRAFKEAMEALARRLEKLED